MGKQEMTDIIYDTLMQNKQHPQFNLDVVEDQEVDSKAGLITFIYDDVWIGIVVKPKEL